MESSQKDDLEVFLTEKKGHKAPINSLIHASKNGETGLFFTSSEDKTVRLWDLRTGGSIKMFSSPNIPEETSSLAYHDGLIYVSSGENVFCFDERTCGIISKLEKSMHRGECEDEVNNIKISPNGDHILALKDS